MIYLPAGLCNDHLLKFNNQTSLASSCKLFEAECEICSIINNVRILIQSEMKLRWKISTVRARIVSLIFFFFCFSSHSKKTTKMKRYKIKEKWTKDFITHQDDEPAADLSWLLSFQFVYTKYRFFINSFFFFWHVSYLFHMIFSFPFELFYDGWSIFFYSSEWLVFIIIIKKKSSNDLFIQIIVRIFLFPFFYNNLIAFNDDDLLAVYYGIYVRIVFARGISEGKGWIFY